MCFTVSFEGKAIKAVKEHLQTYPKLEMRGEFNSLYYLVSGFSHPKLPVFKYDAVEICEWGLIPSFAKSEEKAKELANMTLNARSDTIHQKPSFKNSIKKNRCILPLDGFYEWQHNGKLKQPYYIYPSDETVFYLGCIYNNNTFSIITTDANPLMANIHNTKKRMPLILPKSSIETWVDPTTDIALVDQMMQPYSTELMSAHTISTDAGNPKLNRNVAWIKDKVDVGGTLF